MEKCTNSIQALNWVVINNNNKFQYKKIVFNIVAQVLNYIQNALYFRIIFNLYKNITYFIKIYEKDISIKLFIFSIFVLFILTIV